MKALVCDRYGPPSMLRVRNVPDPAVREGELLVRVRAASVNALDWRLSRGDPFLVRLSYGWSRPKHEIPGADAAGVVEAIGRGAEGFAVGDEVYGDLSGVGMGAFAERVSRPARAWAPRPRKVPFDVAAAVPVAAGTALQALRDVGRVRPGERVLVNGASGGVGSFAVQVARALGAEVSGVASARNVEMVHGLGATTVVDYTREDPTRRRERYDVVVDCAAHRPVWDWRGALAPGGRYVMVGGDLGPMMQAMALGPILSRRGHTFSALVAKPNRADLDTLARWVDDGVVKPLLDRRLPLEQAAEAVGHVDAGHTRGKTVVTMEP